MLQDGEKELAFFKKHFGEYKIIKSFKGDKMDKKQVLRVVKQLQIISVKPWQDTMKCSLKSSDGDWFSAFGNNVSKDVEGIAQGDVVEIEYTVNERGFKNFTSVKLTEGEGTKETEETPPDEEGEKVGVFEDKTQYAIMKQSSAKVAATVLRCFPLDGMDIDGIMKVFKTVWNTILEEFGQ